MKKIIYLSLCLGLGIIFIVINISCQTPFGGEDYLGGFKEIGTDPAQGTISINVLCVMSNACGNFESLEYSIYGNTIVIHFYAFYSGDACAQIIVTEEHRLDITGLSPGTYTIKASTDYYYDYSQYGWSEKLEIILN